MRVTLLTAAALAAIAPRPAADVPAPKPSLAEPAISPDGREIAFVSGGDVWTVPAAGGTAQLLVSHPANESRPFWSPDGKAIAFVSTRTGNGDVYVLTLAGGELRRVTWDDAFDQLDGWSRDGEWLYFSSIARDIAGMNDVHRVRATGGTPMPVAADRYASEYWAAPSPDGSALAITARGIASGQWWRKGHSHLDESEIAVVRFAADGTPSYTTVEPVGAKHGWPMWSPDGGSLFYMSDRGGAENLWTKPVRGGEGRKLTSFTNGRVLWPTISRDGKTIAFERDFGVWTLDVASGAAKAVPVVLRGAPAGPGVERTTLTTGFTELALAPDGKKIAVVGRGELFAGASRDGGDAARVTTTAAAEGMATWAPDSRRIAYASDRDGRSDLYVHDFAARTETRLTTGGTTNAAPVWSPDGKSIAYVRDGRELRVLEVAGGNDRQVARGFFGLPPFIGPGDVTWSPDGRWIAYVTQSNASRFDNVFVVPAAGGEARQVTWLSNASAGPVVWSADGTYLLVGTGQRTEQRQLVRVDLVPRTPRFREDQFRDLFNQETPRPVPGQPARPATQPAPSQDRARPDSTRADDPDSARRDPGAAPAKPRRTEIVLEGIRTRLTFLPVGIDVFAPQVSPDGKTLLFTSNVAGQTNLHTFSLDELAREEPVARQLTSTPGNKGSARWSPDGKEVYFLDNGRPSAITVESRVVRPVGLTAEMDADFATEKREVLGQAWRWLRDNFFDEKMNGVDWNASWAEYSARVEGARTREEVQRLLNLMIGDLNASHTGAQRAPVAQPHVGKLGLRFDRAEYERSGRLRVSEVLPLSPAAVGGVKVGEFLVSVEGSPTGRTTNLDSLLAYRVNRRTSLGVAPSAGGTARDVAVRPVNGPTERVLLYRAWVESRREHVAKASGGRLGYVHIPDMSAQSLEQLYRDLDAENYGKEGVVVDVRNNNGGFVNVYAIDVLARKPYLRMETRGMQAVPARTALGQRALEKPTVLVTNQHSLSDAEDFTEGYRALGLGKVVGEPTSGWIIFTSNVPTLDGTVVRLPSTRIYGADGKDMEMNPRPVDVMVRRAMGEYYAGKDTQLDEAVKQLLGQLGRAPSRADGGG